MIKSLFIKSFFSSIKFCQKKTLNANAKEYFDVVSDVANYKLFLPWCSQSQIISK